MYRMHSLNTAVDAPVTQYLRCSTGSSHHWRIDEAQGPTSPGACKVCGALREFKNWIAEADYTTRTEHEFAASLSTQSVPSAG